MAVSSYVVAAICGCFKRESGVNPGIWESLIVPPDTFYHVYAFDHIGGYGFGQFTNVPIAGGVSWRCRDYYEWCVNNGYQPEDGNAQLDYIINVEKVWMNSPQQRGSYATIDEFLNSTSTNLEDLTWDWLASWEGVPGDAFAERYAFAQLAFQYIAEHANDDPSSYSWITGNFYLSQEQMLNNTMCAYFYLQGYIPGPGYPGSVNDFVAWCIQKCNDPNVGYSQQYREEQTVGGITYYDCSSFVWYGLKHSGFDIDATSHPDTAFNTTMMPEDLALMGFVEIDRAGELKPGDIAVNPDHTEVVYQGGQGTAVFMGAHSAQLPLPQQVSINNYTQSGTDYASIWRFRSGQPQPPTPTPGHGKKMSFIMFLKRII